MESRGVKGRSNISYGFFLTAIVIFSFGSNWLIVINFGQSRLGSSFRSISLFPIQLFQKKTPSSYLQCEFNQPYPRPKHTCTSNVDLEISYCHMESVKVLVDNVEVSKGNESVADVLGRTDEAELPRYTAETFLIERSLELANEFKREEDRFYLKDVLDATFVRHDSPECTDYISGPVLLITRYEYCNLFHTMTDWFNTFFALSSPTERPTILFLDGHAKGSLDPVWEQVFGVTRFIKSYPAGTRLCLEDATFIPAGYASPLWAHGRIPPSFPPCPEMMEAFLKRFLAAYDALETKMIPGRVTIVGRKAYVAHPRSISGKVTRAVTNLPELAKQIKNSRVVYFETMPMKEQLQVIRESQVLIANHGAALTHLLFLHDGATVVEFMGDGTNMFNDLAAWRPSVNRVLMPYLREDTSMDPYIMSQTVQQVQTILEASTVVAE